MKGCCKGKHYLLFPPFGEKILNILNVKLQFSCWHFHYITRCDILWIFVWILSLPLYTDGDAERKAAANNPSRWGNTCLLALSVVLISGMLQEPPVSHFCLCQFFLIEAGSKNLWWFKTDYYYYYCYLKIIYSIFLLFYIYLYYNIYCNYQFWFSS